VATVIIKRLNNLIQLSIEGDLPLPENLVALLHPHLSYEKKEFLRGQDTQLLPNMEFPIVRRNTRGRMRFTPVSMYELRSGALITGYGMLTKIVSVLDKAGIGSRYVDLTPPHEDPTIFEPDWANLAKKVPTLRPKQLECLQRLAGTDCGIIAAAPGFGKSFMVEAICHLYPRARIHYVVPQKDVAQKVAAVLTGKFPNVGVYGGGSHKPGERITVFTSGSVHHSDGAADILLCDEVHDMMTDKMIEKITATWRTTRNYGFTATPKGRMDGADAQLELYFGPQIFYLSYQEACELGLVVPIVVRWLPINMDINPCAGKEDVRKMRLGIWRNEARNRAIAQDIRNNYPDPDTQVLVLCATVEHAIHLWQFLPEFKMCFSDQDMGNIEWYQKTHMLPHNFEIVTGKIRERMRTEFAAGTLKRVIATDVWTTGVDFSSLQVLYRVDARSSQIKDVQAPGRVSRISPDTGKQFGEVIDCWDRFDPTFLRKSEGRRRTYKSLGWKQTTISPDGQLTLF